MAWDSAVVTIAGNKMLERVVPGKPLKLDYAAGGTGSVDPVALIAQTALVNEKRQFPIINIQEMEKGQRLNIQIDNVGLTEGFQMTQIGIWAHVEGDAPALLAIIQDSAEKGSDKKPGIYIPAETEIGDFSLNFYAAIVFDGCEKFELTVDTQALVSLAYLNERMAGKVDKESGKGLSANDYTDADKQKLESIEAGAQKNDVHAKGSFTGNLNTCTEPGVYWCNLADCTNGPLSSGSGYLEVCKASSLTWFQRFTRWMSAGGPCVAIRFWSHAAGAFMPWAWDSPSMASGTEYLTTERWGDSPVYTKIVDCGTMPSKTGKEVAHGAAAATVIRVCGAMSNGRSLPFANTDSGAATVSADKTNIILKTDYDSITTAVVQIWYTKD